MRVWLDDLRKMPEGFTHHAKDAEECISLIETGKVEHISLDHDLAQEHYTGVSGYCKPHRKTGYDVACVIEDLVHDGRIKMPTWEVHSMNPIGAKRITQAMKRADQFFKEKGGNGLFVQD